jgi:hypothetical protein
MSTIPTLNIEAVTEAIRTRLHRASSAGDNWLLFNGDEWDQKTYEGHLFAAWLLIVDTLYRLGHGPLLEAAQENFAKFKIEPSAVEMGPDEPYLKWIGYAYSYLEMISDLYLPKPAPERHHLNFYHLLTVIRNSEYYISSRAAFGFAPAREEDVHQRIEEMLKCTFTDVVSRPQLSKPIKGFAADSGIPSLQTLLEYKFIRSENEAKAALEQVLADINGYQCDRYNKFVFAIYETSRLYPETDWAAAIAAAKPTNQVSVVVIHGIPPTESDQKASTELRKKRKSSNPVETP